MKRILFFFLLILGVISCQRENIDEMEIPVLDDKPNVTVESSVVGLVSDENGDPINDAQVFLGNLQTTTNELGLFSFENELMSQNNSYVQVQKEGYFNGSRKFSTDLEEKVTVRVQLLEKTAVGEVHTSDGGSLEIGPSKVELPAGTYLQSDGQAYNGDVEVFAKWLDPTKRETYDQMPGELTGLNQAGESNVLVSYGMMGVELLSTNGEYLDLPQGQQAVIQMKVPTELLSTAPSTIPLWHFDEISGNWIEEGEANLENGYYIGEVGHFSFWNCDAPYPLVEIDGYIEIDGVAYENGQLKITDLDSGFCAYGYTGERGFFTGKVPRDASLLLEIIDHCGFALQDIDLGSFSNDHSLGILDVDANVANVIISGYLFSCENEQTENGYILVVGNNFESTIEVENDGSFYAEIPGCGMDTWVELYGIDVTEGLISEAYPINFVGFNDNILLYTCNAFYETNVSIYYNGVDWISQDSSNYVYYVQSYYDDDNIPQIEFISIFAIPSNIPNPNLSPIFWAEFENDIGENTASYYIQFLNHGFSIMGECNFLSQNQGGSEVISLTGEFLEEPDVYDPGLYPGDVIPLIFEITLEK